MEDICPGKEGSDRYHEANLYFARGRLTIDAEVHHNERMRDTVPLSRTEYNEYLELKERTERDRLEGRHVITDLEYMEYQHLKSKQ